MGWQGRIHRRSELQRVAAHFGVSWQQITVGCWRDNDVYWVTLPDGSSHRIQRDTLDDLPSALTNGPLTDQGKLDLLRLKLRRNAERRAETTTSR